MDAVRDIEPAGGGPIPYLRHVGLSEVGMLTQPLEFACTRRSLLVS